MSIQIPNELHLVGKMRLKISTFPLVIALLHAILMAFSCDYVFIIVRRKLALVILGTKRVEQTMIKKQDNPFECFTHPKETIFPNLFKALIFKIKSLYRALNKSQQLAKFASYFMWTRRLLFFGNYPPKRQNLMMSVFCSNTLIFAPECWKCTLRGPDFQIFPGGMPPDPLVTRSFSACKFFPSPPTAKLLPSTYNFTENPDYNTFKRPFGIHLLAI